MAKDKKAAPKKAATTGTKGPVRKDSDLLKTTVGKLIVSTRMLFALGKKNAFSGTKYAETKGKGSWNGAIYNLTKVGGKLESLDAKEVSALEPLAKAAMGEIPTWGSKCQSFANALYAIKGDRAGGGGKDLGKAKNIWA